MSLKGDSLVSEVEDKSSSSQGVPTVTIDGWIVLGLISAALLGAFGIQAPRPRLVRRRSTER